MTLRNPFTPTFGKVPPHMAGRDRVIVDLLAGLENGPGDPNLTTILIGARGTGKTALLSHISREAGARGWISVDVSARPGMLEGILLGARKAATHLIEDARSPQIKGVQIGQLLGVEWERADKTPSTWRLDMEDLLDALEEHGAGLLITVDEVRGNLEEMIDLVSVYQHFVREDRRVALLMAGLPFKTSELLANEDISFLRRAQHRYFGRIEDTAVETSLEATVREAGRSIEAVALRRAVEEIDGFPYMMQLLAYRAWAENPESPIITLSDVESAATVARSELETSVLETTYRELSPKDRAFLFAMLEDGGESAMTAIAKRMGVKGNYAGQYKRRLLEQGLIETRGSKAVGYALPGLKEFLQEKVAGDR